MRNRIVSLSVMIFIALIVSISVLGQQTVEKKPEAGLTAEQIIAKNIEAIGGKAALDKIKTRITKGTLEISAQGITGTMEEYKKAPNKIVSLGVINGIGTIAEGFNGQVAWGNNPFTGLREKSGTELASAKRDAELAGELNWKQLYKSVELAGSEKVGDSETYLLKFTPNEGAPLTKYYDKKSFLVVREDVVAETPQGTVPTTTYASDYREVDGVKLPFDIRQEASGQSIHIKITEIKHNVPIDDAKFDKPAK